MQNKDRKGKWQPFDALEGYSSSLRDVEYKKEKKAKPILFPDELAILNEKLTNAYNEKLLVKVEYYKDGYIETITGIVTKIDLVNKEITMKQDLILKKIKLSIITKIENEEI